MVLCGQSRREINSAKAHVYDHGNAIIRLRVGDGPPVATGKALFSHRLVYNSAATEHLSVVKHQ